MKILRKKWTEEEINYLKNNFNNKSYLQISRDLNKNYSNVKRKAKKLELKQNRFKFGEKHFTFDENFWSNYNPIVAYYAGFSGADAMVNKNHTVWRFQIKLALKDKCILEKFKEYVKTNHKIREFKENGYDKCNIVFSSANKWKNDLEKYWNITTQKTFTLQPPPITNEDLTMSYLIGSYDGDGNISFIKSSKDIVISICGSSLIYLEWFKKQIDKKFTYSRGELSKIYKAKNTFYTYAVRGLRAAIIIDYLKKIPVPKLERKWNQIEVLDYIKNQKIKYPYLFFT